MAKKMACALAFVAGVNLVQGVALPARTPAQIYEHVKPSIVFVEVLRRKTGKWSSGSGVVFNIP